MTSLFSSSRLMDQQGCLDLTLATRWGSYFVVTKGKRNDLRERWGTPFFAAYARISSILISLLITISLGQEQFRLTTVSEREGFWICSAVNNEFTHY
jgi:hypothetical protein